MRRAACTGMGGLSASRPSLMNRTRRSETWHPEQMNVWCSTPRAATASSGNTFVRINSAPQAVQRITRTHLLGAHPGYRAGEDLTRSLLIAIRYNLSGNGSHVSLLAALYLLLLNCSRSRLILSASRKGNSASHRAFKTAFGISSAVRSTPRDVRTSTISY